jgi:RNA polymerase sigma factor (sigma-70 family)
VNSDRELTSHTLLERVRDPDDRAAWERFYALYSPMLEGFARANGLAPEDVEEVRDECFALVAEKMPGFEYDRAKGAFKGWLYNLVRGKVIDRLRRPRQENADTALLAGLLDPEPSPDDAWEQIWRGEHLRFALQEASTRLSERTYQTFVLLLLEELSVDEVCERMGMNANQVYKAKAQALRQVREVLDRIGT